METWWKIRPRPSRIRRRNGYGVRPEALSDARRNRYAGEANRIRRPVAESGTPQKQVRWGDQAQPLKGRRRNGYALAKGFAEMGTRRESGRRLRTRTRTCFCGDNRLPKQLSTVFGGNLPVSKPGRPRPRRIGYALRRFACGEACGRPGLSPQNPVRARRRYGFGWSQIRVRPFAESGTDRRRIGFAGRLFPLTNQWAWLHVYGLQVVNPYRYRLLVADGWRTVDNPAGLPTVRHHATSHEILRAGKNPVSNTVACVPVSA